MMESALLWWDKLFLWWDQLLDGGMRLFDGGISFLMVASPISMVGWAFSMVGSTFYGGINLYTRVVFPIVDALPCDRVLVWWVELVGGGLGSCMVG